MGVLPAAVATAATTDPVPENKSNVVDALIEIVLYVLVLRLVYGTWNYDVCP